MWRALLTAMCVAAMALAGVRPADAVVGGKKANIKDWPGLMVLRTKADWAGEEGLGITDHYFCMGVMISKDWMLVAAHCVYGINAGEPDFVKVTSTGEWVAAHKTNQFFVPGARLEVVGPTDDLTQIASIWKPERIVYHASFNPHTFENDIALVKLATPVSGAFLPLAEAAESGIAVSRTPPLKIAGFGKIDNSWDVKSFKDAAQNIATGGTAQLMEIELRKVNFRACVRANASLTFDGYRQVCVDAINLEKDGEGSCQGDNGGPLVMSTPDGQPVIFAIVSYGPNECGSKSKPEVATRVPAHLQWIRAVTKQNIPSIKVYDKPPIPKPVSPSFSMKQGERRLALILATELYPSGRASDEGKTIVITNYQGAAADAKAMQTQLAAAGFEVYTLTNPTSGEFLDAALSFEALSASASIAAVFLSGRSALTDKGRVLLATDARVANRNGKPVPENTQNGGEPTDLSVKTLARSFTAARGTSLIIDNTCNIAGAPTDSARLAFGEKPCEDWLAARPRFRRQAILFASTHGLGRIVEEQFRSANPKGFGEIVGKRLNQKGPLLENLSAAIDEFRILSKGAAEAHINVSSYSRDPVCLKDCPALNAVAKEDLATKAECSGAYDAPKQGAETRYGLVIGNIGYRGEKLQPLVSPEKDARQISSALVSAGFKVRTCLNLNKVEMDKEFDALALATRKAADAWTGPKSGGPSVFVYFSGHGAATAKDQANYLIPVRQPIESSVQLPGNAVKLDDISGKLALTGARVAFIVIDACRNVLSEEKSGGSKGLAPVPRRAGIVMAFAAAPGQTAPDSSNYSTALAAQIQKTPPEEATILFKRVGDAVNEADSKQEPHTEAGIYKGDFYFQPPTKK